MNETGGWRSIRHNKDFIHSIHCLKRPSSIMKWNCDFKAHCSLLDIDLLRDNREVGSVEFVWPT